ncbi:MAG: chromosomal replication initiator protein DnaA [Fusobacteria bacterium]|nr:chromosomal replication initiator protein DnaA [Fusobacteriota bacterium]
MKKLKNVEKYLEKLKNMIIFDIIKKYYDMKKVTGGSMLDQAEKVWERVLKVLEMQKGSSISESDYSMIIKNVKPLRFENNHLYLSVENKLIKEKFEELISEKVNEILNSILIMEEYTDVIVEVTKESTPEKYEFENEKPPLFNKENTGETIYGEIFETKLQPKNTFSEFVVGRTNNFAFSASEAVAKEPGRRYNPLFVYGDVGLGKTHLMQAIGNLVLSQNPNKKVYYCSSEQFTNDFITSIKDGKGQNFRKKYRNLDVLLIDDIQFLAGKNETQEEFFHTFNVLKDSGKQIVLTSDRPPKNLEKLEKRLVSRFEGGLTVDIQLPDYETRVAILQKKAEQEKVYVPSAVLKSIAEHVSSNIRELEGSLNQIVAMASLKNQEMTVELVENVLREKMRLKTKSVTKEKVLSVVSEHFDISEEEMKSKKRQKEIANARQVSMYLLREMLDMQLVAIGSVFGGKDHSTVLHSISKVEEDMKNDKYLSNDIKMLKDKIKG